MIRRILRTLALAGALTTVPMAGQCSTTGGGRGGAFCDVEQPTRLTAGVIARMSHDELAAAASHNRFGQTNCGWRAASSR